MKNIWHESVFRCSLIVVILFFSSGLCDAQTKGGPVSPVNLIPAESLIVLSTDGNSVHTAAWEKTAAFEAFQRSGMIESLKNLVQGVVQQLPGKGAKAIPEIYDFLSENGTTISLSVPEGDGPSLPFAVFVAHGASEHIGLLNEMAESVGKGVEPRIEKHGKRTITRCVVPETNGIEIVWWSEDPHVVVVIGIDAVTPSLAVIEGKASNFSTTALWKSLATKADFDRKTIGVVNCELFATRFGAVPLPGETHTISSWLKTLGLSNLTSAIYQSGYRERAIYSKLTLKSPVPHKGLLSLATGPGMTLKQLPPLPADHVSFYAQSVSLDVGYDEIVKSFESLVGVLSPKSNELMRALKRGDAKELGIDVKADLLAALGPVQCVYSDLGQAFLGADLAIILQVKNPELLDQTIERIVKHLSTKFSPEDLSILTRQKHGRKLVTFQINRGSFNPTIVLDKNWLGIGGNSQSAEAFAMRLNGTLPSWKPTTEFSEAVSSLPDSFAAVSVSYPRRSIRSLVAIAPLALGILQGAINQLAQSNQLPAFQIPPIAIDFPPAEIVVAPLFPNVAIAEVSDDGIEWTCQKSVSSIPFMCAIEGHSIAVAAVIAALIIPAVN